MKRIMAIIIAALFMISTANAVGEIPFSDPIEAFGYQEKLEGFVEAERCCVRARYRLSLPENGESVHEQILNAYSAFENIYLIEYGIVTISPIVEGKFVCVGIDAEENMKILPTPFELLSRVYDYHEFDDILIVEE